MQISDFLSRENVLFNVRLGDKNELLEKLALAAGTKISVPAGEILAELTNREKLGSTGLGDGIAVPHARLSSIAKPFGMIVKLKQPIDFDAVDGKPVDIVFVLLLPPKAQSESLSALACVARKLRVAEIAEKLRRAGSADDVFSQIVSR
jgi:PTS system nitrogen regulatory IIA component